MGCKIALRLLGTLLLSAGSSGAVLCAEQAPKAAPAPFTETPAQWDVSAYEYELPLRIPIRLSANYGELRKGHFHAGIDLKTEGVIGKGVYAAADGYVSRISVSPTGYGKAIYIQHPNQTTTVYGHVERFYPELERHVYDYQYAHTTFPTNLYFTPEQFPVRRGDLIAYSGNRGSSGGPHLHYELRDGAQRPLNPLLHNALTVEDTIAPRPVKLYWFSLDTVRGVPISRLDQSFALKSTGIDQYTLADPAKKINIAGAGYFVVEVAEHKNNTANPMAIYRLGVRLDGALHYEMSIDAIGFDQTRYELAINDTERSTRNGAYRLFTTANNPLPIYTKGLSNGVIGFKDFTPHQVAISMEDDCRNRSLLYFDIARTPGARTTAPDSTGTVLRWDEAYYADHNGLVLSILPKSLYNSILLNVQEEAPLAGMYSSQYTLTPQGELLQKYMNLSIEASELPERLRDKALIGTFNKRGVRVALGGAWSAGETPEQKTTPENPHPGRVAGRTRSFGTYYIAVDTIAPKLSARFTEGADLRGKESLSLTVSDDFSGVASYSATIDGKWALLEYDPKTNTLTHPFDSERWEQGTTHRMEVRVSDERGNTTTLRRSYIH